jgi:hypothetical protein
MTDQPGVIRRPPPNSSLDLWVYICERCGDRMEERQCKILCGNCGFSRDCSDP